MGFMDFLFPKKLKMHELKWKLPEVRMLFPVKDAEKSVFDLKKNKAVFANGGQYFDIIHAKEYGEGVFAYFIVRTEKLTQKETLLFDGYMLQEEDKLGFEVQSSYSMAEQLDKLGYQEAAARELQEWNFTFGAVRIKVLDIDGLGDFVEFALAETKIDRAREAQEKTLEILLKKLGLNKSDSIPTDAITLQLASSSQKK
ncbi:MAG TPA: hypothetical protein VI875_02250 [Candidatus Norongarragalinales archaeon]|nr:hypothetical protein [Candidatus Norongarragalinales archaeon]